MKILIDGALAELLIVILVSYQTDISCPFALVQITKADDTQCVCIVYYHLEMN